MVIIILFHMIRVEAWNWKKKKTQLLEIKPKLYKTKKYALNKINNNYWRNKAVNLNMA